MQPRQNGFTIRCWPVSRQCAGAPGLDQLRSASQQPSLQKSDVERLIALYRSGALAETAALAKALSERHPIGAVPQHAGRGEYRA
jgi:hypothetical protein